MSTLTRPVLRYHGGKFRIAPWLLSFFPSHRVYCEPFGGAASVLMHKPRSYAEVYNDLDGEIVNVFRVMRDPQQSAVLRYQLEHTPFARDEYEACYDPAPGADEVELARRTIVKSFMGFSSSAIHADHPRGMRTTRTVTMATASKRPQLTGFRSNGSNTVKRSGSTPARDWSIYPSHIDTFCRRLQGVVIDNRPATEVIRTHDSQQTMFYVDPPYPMETRDRGNDYMHEMTDDEHRELASVLRECFGMVLVSSNPSELYTELYAGWHSEQMVTRGGRNNERTEVVWMNDALASKLNRRLF